MSFPIRIIRFPITTGNLIEKFARHVVAPESVYVLFATDGAIKAT